MKFRKVFVLIIAIISVLSITSCGKTKNTLTPYDYDYDGSAIGTGVGLNPGRVVWAYDDNAFNWTGDGAWYEQENFDEKAVMAMLVDGINSLAGKDNIYDSLDAIFLEFNQRVYGKNEGYVKGQKIAIKGNMNVTADGNESKNQNTSGYFPTPLTIKSLLTILVSYGIPASDITFYDTSRSIPAYLKEMCSSGILKGVNMVSIKSDIENLVDTTKPITWSRDFSLDYHPDYDGLSTMSTTYFPTCVTEATYMINLFNLRGHTLAGFTASAKNHYGSIMPGKTEEDGTVTFPYAMRINPPIYAGIHAYIACRDYYDKPAELWTCPKIPLGSYTPLVDLMANADCGGKTILYICDALAATVNQGVNLSMNEQWYQTPFGDGTGNERGWTNSFFISQDPVAIDSVCYDFIEAEQDLAQTFGDTRWDKWLPEGNTAENYLIEAALADNPPSGTYYQDGYGNHLASLGIHERWNNAKDKEYSGIDFVKLFK